MKTIRIVVAVTSEGSWCAFSDEQASDWWTAAHKRQYGVSSHVVFVDAEVPLPAHPVKGQVVQVNPVNN